ncbi:hypothetical protein LINPERHAP1_LOCUS16878 [Linum perenne]
MALQFASHSFNSTLHEDPTSPLLQTSARTEEEDTRRKLRREKAHLQIEVLSGGKADSIKALVNKISKSLLEEKDENGNTALHNAAAAGNRAAVEILMENNR